MEFKLGKDFAELSVVEGILENTTPKALVELCITSGEIQDGDIITLGFNDKHVFHLQEGQKLFARTINRFKSSVNYLSVDVNGSDMTPTDVYTKSQVDSKLKTKANTADVYSKVDVDEKLTSKANASEVYSKTETDEKLGTKVDSVIGKQLSTEDFTTELKQKLVGIDLSTLQGKTDETLQTSNKTIVGAINELLEKINALSPQP